MLGRGRVPLCFVEGTPTLVFCVVIGSAGYAYPSILCDIGSAGCVSDISELRLQEYWDMLVVTGEDARSWYMISGDAKCVVNKDMLRSCLPQLMLIQRLSPRLTELRAPECPVPLPDDTYVAIRQTQLVDTDTDSDPEEASSEAEDSEPLSSSVPLLSEEFKAFESLGTGIVSSHSLVSSDSTAPLSPDHLLTHVSPTSTLTRVSFHRITARMAVRTQPTLSLGMSARIAEAAALAPSSFRKRYISSYESSSSSSPTLPVWKRYRGTSELILDIDSEGDELGEEDTEEDKSDEDHGLDDGSQGLEDKGLGLEEEEAAPEGQQQAILVVDTAMSEPLGLRYEAARRRALESIKEIAPSTYEAGQSSRFMPEQEGVSKVDRLECAYTVYPILPAIPNQSQIIWENSLDGWKSLSPLQLAVEEVMSD
ncbi:hypothetical protein Tco_0943960 [Tanacetum coccineum]